MLLSTCNQYAWTLFPAVGIIVAILFAAAELVERKDLREKYGKDWNKTLKQ